MTLTTLNEENKAQIVGNNLIMIWLEGILNPTIKYHNSPKCLELPRISEMPMNIIIGGVVMEVWLFWLYGGLLS